YHYLIYCLLTYVRCMSSIYILYRFSSGFLQKEFAMFNKLKFLFRKPRSAQEIFDAVIDAGFYTDSTDWMCHSLELARRCGVISKEEKEIARREIRAYLGRFTLLETKLYHYSLPNQFSDRLAIYRNWANRPS